MALTEADLALLSLGAELEVRPTGTGMQIHMLRPTSPDLLRDALTRPKRRYGDEPGQYRLLAVGLHPGRPSWVKVKPIIDGEIQDEIWWIVPQSLTVVR